MTAGEPGRRAGGRSTVRLSYNAVRERQVPDSAIKNHFNIDNKHLAPSVGALPCQEQPEGEGGGAEEEKGEEKGAIGV